MASTFSPTLRLELIGDGDQSGIWGQTTNSNLGTLLEQAITGVQTIAMTDANYTLTSFNGVADEARNALLVFTGTLSQQRNVIAPLVEKIYILKNSTTGGFSIQIIGASGTGVVIPNGVTAMVYCDGTNFFAASTGTSGNFAVNGNLSVTGTTALTGALSGSTAAFSGAISSVSPAFTGVPTAPTAAPGTTSTQIATTAFVQNVAGALGTMSSQNSNNVNITGGTITGSYALTAANATNAVNATNATTATTATTATSANQFQGRTKLGLGVTGEVWNDVAGSRGFNSQYTNSFSYPIAVSATATCAVTSTIQAFVNGVLIAWYQWQFNGCGSYGGTFIIVPPGATYQLNSGQGVFQWKELY